MASKISIINMALGWLGAPPIAGLTEKRPEAIYASQYYDSALEQTLRDHKWNFAQRRKRLAALNVPDGYQGVYENAYALPVDCLHAHTVLVVHGASDIRHAQKTVGKVRRQMRDCTIQSVACVRIVFGADMIKPQLRSFWRGREFIHRRW